jgi:hypothetical protein
VEDIGVSDVYTAILGQNQLAALELAGFQPAVGLSGAVKVMVGAIVLPAYAGVANPVLATAARPSTGDTGVITVGNTGTVSL